ncbi:MAG: DMT family transporter [Pseudomonadota bacterium]
MLPLFALNVPMVLAGIGIPIMAALIGGLGSRLGNPVQAATLLLALAFAASTRVLLIRSEPIVSNLKVIPTYYFLGGLFVAFYVMSVTSIAHEIGVGNAIVLMLLGQTLASAIIDHCGCFGAQETPLTMSRALGLVLMLCGIVLTRRTIDISY